jgi:hypothetical protein
MLLCPNQSWSFITIVDNVQIHLAPPDRPSTHSICSPQDNFTVPLFMKGIFYCFHSRTPTKEELDTCQWVKLTDEHFWDPHSDTFQEQE